ncbi:MAG: hypothetical protein ABIP75_09440 [Pyrinomonadaceae bacterium]
MQIFRKRYILVGVATLILGLVAVAAVVGVAKFRGRSTTVSSEVKVYLLDDQGGVNGLLLTSGDQLRFSPQMGQAVQAQIKLGDTVTATGQAGKASSYGREFRVEQIAFNGHTIVEAEPGPGRDRGPRGEHRGGPTDRDDHDGPPDGPRGSRGPRGPEDRDGGPDRPEVSAPGNNRGPDITKPEAAPSGSPVVAPNTGGPAAPIAAPLTGPVPPAAPDQLTATSTIWVHLVNGHGDVDGLIFASGEQIRFSPRVGALIVAAENGAATSISVEGTRVKSDRGTVIRPAQLTVGNQTIALGR